MVFQSIPQLLLNTEQYISEFAQSDRFHSDLQTAFGTDYDLEALQALQSAFLTGDFLHSIELEIVPDSFLNEALGAYSAASHTIYLSERVVNSPQATAVFLEEVGHAVDTFLSVTDSPGDEGAIFSALVRGESFDEAQLQQWQSEDDSAIIVVNGVEVKVEQATFTVTNNNDSGAGSLRQAILDANSTPETDIIDFDSGLAGQTILLTSGQLDITEPLTVQGLGADQLTIDADGNSRVFNVDDSDAYNVIDVSISDVTITGGNATDGGGIFNEENLTITNGVISGNTASNRGGGIYNATNTGSDAGTLTLVNSTISGNDASYRGGGIYNNNTATVTNSTIAQNYAQYGGGGFFNNYEATVNHATIAQNQVPDTANGGGIYNNDNLDIFNTIVAGHTNGDVFSLGSLSSSRNITQDGSIPGFNSITGDPLLDPAGLQNNGGSTPTIALQGGSPAIDAGDNTRIAEDILDADGDTNTAEGIPFDQRGTGFDRIINGTVDIGAFEGFIQETLVVDILDDENDGDFSAGDLSLREAIEEISPGGIITFASTLLDETIVLNGTELLIDKSLTIDGESNNITIDGGNLTRVFNVDDGDNGNSIDVSISDVTITRGEIDGNGGGILNRENLTVSNSTISDHTASNIGGGIINYGEITLTNSTLSGNNAGVSGGGISNQSSGIATITNTTIENNSAASSGGGVTNSGNLTLNFSTISQNISSYNGGGVHNDNPGDLTLNTSIISGNSATNSGGGMYNAATATLNSSTVSGNNADDGGGLYVGSAYGVANLNNSTVSGNYAAFYGGGLLISGGYGYESIFYAATANISNSTIYGNTAYSGGGGLYNYGGVATINNSTIAGNSANSPLSGGGVRTGSQGVYDSTTTLESTIVADNEANLLLNDIAGLIPVDATTSLVGLVSGSLNDILDNLIGTDPQFDPEGLKRNGGFVETLALQSGSPAIDVGSNPDSLPFDQRGLGFDRVIDGNEDGTPQADIGAFEFQNGANTEPIEVTFKLYEDRGAGRFEVTSGEIFTSNFELEVLVEDIRTGGGVVSANYDLTFDPLLVQNGDDFASITDTANPLLTANFPLFRNGSLDNGTGTITDLGASAIKDENPDNGEAIGTDTPEVLSTLSFSEVLSRSSSTFTFNLTIDPQETGFSDGLLADPSAITFNQTVTLNNAPVLNAIDDADVAENAVATDIVLNGSDITATDDGLGNEVELSLDTPLDGSDNPLFAFLDSSKTGAARFVTTSTVSDNFPVVVTPAGEAVLDFETTTSYSLGITASDGFKSSTEETFTVNVTDVAPTIAVSQPSITFGTPLSLFREGEADSNFVRPAFPDIFKSLIITNSMSGETESNDTLNITDFVINASGVTITSGNVPEGGDIILNPGESHRITFEYAPTIAGESFDINDGLVINSNAANGAAFNIKLIGQSTFNSDVDYSGTVDLDDLAVLDALTFGSTLGSDGYDPTADMNGDGILNRGEIVVLNGELFNSI